jgi:hypothetical protein
VSTPKLPGQHSQYRQHSQYDQPSLPPKPLASPEEQDGENLQSINPPQPPKEESASTITEVEPAPLPVEEAPESLQAEPPPERIVFPAAPENSLRLDPPAPTGESDTSPAAPRNIIPQNQQP